MDAQSITEQALGTAISTVGTANASSGELSLITIAVSYAGPVAFVFAMVLIILRSYEYIIQSATEGTQDKQFKWFILGIVIAIALIIPLKNGLSSSQNIMLWGIKGGSNLANIVWGELREKTITSPAVTTVTQGSIRTSANALRMLTCAIYEKDWKGLTVIKETGNGLDLAEGQCGRIRWPVLSYNNPGYTNGVKKATIKLLKDLAPISNSIINIYKVGHNYEIQGKGSVNKVIITDEQLSEAVSQFRVAASKYSSSIDSVALSALSLEDSYKQSDDWAEAGKDWHILQSMYSNASALSAEAQKSIQYLNSDRMFDGDGRFGLDKYISAADVIASNAVTTSVGQGLKRIDFAPWEATCEDNKCSYDNFQRHVALWLRGEIVHELSNSTKDPMGATIRLGNTFNNGADVLKAAQFVAAGVSALPIVGDNLTNLIEQVQKRFGTTAKELEQAGIKLAIWIPKTPTTLWAHGLEMWLFNCIIALIAAPLIAVSFSFKTDGILSTSTKIGLTICSTAIFMPSFLTLGYAISQGLLPIVFQIFNDVYWGDMVATKVQGLVAALGDLEFYIANLYRMIFSVMFFSYIMLMWGVWKLFSYAGDSSSEHSMKGTMNEAASGNRGAAGTDGPGKYKFGSSTPRSIKNGN